MNSDKNAGSNVVDLGNFRAKKEMQAELPKGRVPLYQSHLDSHKAANPHLGEKADLGDRMGRIRNSLEKINQILNELKKK